MPATILAGGPPFQDLQHVHFAGVSSPGPEYVYVNGSRSRRSCGSDEISWKPLGPQWILASDFPTNAQQPLLLSKSFCTLAVVWLLRQLIPVENVVSNPGMYTNSSFTLQKDSAENCTLPFFNSLAILKII